MKLLDELHRFYYDMTLSELRSMNDNSTYPNITYNSLLYLDLISYKEDCTVSYLADALHISKSAVTIKVNELIKQGFLTKTQSEKDRRVYYLSITPEVEAEYKQHDKRVLHAAKALEQNYSEAELSLFQRMLEQTRKCYLETAH
ncbi:MarR family winged helix-turn-helix transcriptional regulator [Paenibacillus paeoniae]|uniref:MarR family transcriptional regulator n=1 Tax=Paenibacillus paeoniae TaxID=2292705 RepID=A0A371PMJ5_9BACL|nr:MarR family transcriptional regulator [Paenibacillus paeoniae]REK76879.1 MarR family transcriptional regulator [Paenibacillus paeoniae]